MLSLGLNSGGQLVPFLWLGRGQGVLLCSKTEGGVCGQSVPFLWPGRGQGVLLCSKTEGDVCGQSDSSLFVMDPERGVVEPRELWEWNGSCREGLHG